MRVAFMFLGLFFLSVTSDIVHYHYHGMNPEDIPNHDGVFDWFKSTGKSVSCSTKCRKEHCSSSWYDWYCNKDETPAYEHCKELCNRNQEGDHPHGHQPHGH